MEREPIAEASGQSVGEAKWAAVKELEPNFPGVTADCVRFDVLEEGEQVRVRAEVDVDAWRRLASEIPDEPAERVRAVVTRVTSGLGLEASVDIEETEDEIRATVNGEELGLLIGKHGQTIDALQHLAWRAAFHGTEDRKQVVVDAAGYRERARSDAPAGGGPGGVGRAGVRAAGRARAHARPRAQGRAPVPERAQRTSRLTAKATNPSGGWWSPRCGRAPERERFTGNARRALRLARRGNLSALLPARCPRG